MAEFSYDERGDALAIYKKGEKVKCSVEVLENYFVDLDFEGNIVGVEVLNASSVLSVEKDLLKTIKNADLVSSDTRSGLKKLVFFLQLKDSELKSQVLVPLKAA